MANNWWASLEKLVCRMEGRKHPSELPKGDLIRELYTAMHQRDMAVDYACRLAKENEGLRSKAKRVGQSCDIASTASFQMKADPACRQMHEESWRTLGRDIANLLGRPEPNFDEPIVSDEALVWGAMKARELSQDAS